MGKKGKNGMPRLAREYSKSGLYHTFYRGISRQNIFEEEKDYIKKMDILCELKQDIGFEIYAYCLMSNHVHLLLKENKIGDISSIMQRLLTKYVGWFNKKYERSGTLIGSRFKSQPLENEGSLLSVARYIHQNPLRANMVSSLSDYKWSSYNEYTNNNYIIDTNLLFSMYSRTGFIEYHQVEGRALHEVSDRIAKSDEYIRENIVRIMKGREPCEIGLMPKNERNEIIKMLRVNEGFSIRQIERATGISRGVISRVK